eukprot:RCo038851
MPKPPVTKKAKIEAGGRYIPGNPKQDGFRMPGEFEPHKKCWMLWPERPDNWRDDAKPAQKAFAAVAKAISQFEPVTIGASPAFVKQARGQLPSSIEVVEIAHDDSWMRDMGPSMVVGPVGESSVRAVHWEFNGWGGNCYPFWENDRTVGMKVMEYSGLEGYKPVNRFVLEGGSIHVDGEGTVLTSEECLLNPNRNPHLDKAGIESHLKDYLNAEKVVWIPNGLIGDSDTNGHIDNIACFIRPTEIALAWTDDPKSPQYHVVREAMEALTKARDARGRAFTVHKLPLPLTPIVPTKEELGGTAEGCRTWAEGTQLAGSYINFYIANGGAVVPQFGDPVSDKTAVETLQKLFPERKVVGVPTRDVLLGGGNIHCITQQQPLGSKK